MGSSEGPTRPLIIAGALLLCTASSAGLPLHEARWLESYDLAASLSHEPEECRSAYSDRAMERSAQIGRIAFRSPLILGGQAARVGLSCSSCHRNGRTNSEFHFPGLSGAAGTADVTASLMSSHRGDGIFNPKPIPDLAGDPRKLKVSRDPTKDDLKRFIEGLVTQEFDGSKPPAAVIDGLAAYVRSLSPSACKSQKTHVIRLTSMLNNVEQAVELAKESSAIGDVATARALIAAARSTLGGLNERFQVPGGGPSQAVLRASDADLRAIELSDSITPQMFSGWEGKWNRRVHSLRAAEGLSLFSQSVLQRTIGR